MTGNFANATRLKPMNAYDGAPGTYRSTPVPDDIAASLEAQHTAFWVRMAERKERRKRLLAEQVAQAAADPSGPADAWRELAARHRRRLAELLRLEAAPPPAEEVALGRLGEDSHRPLRGLVLQDGCMIRFSPGRGARLRVLGPGERLEQVDDADSSEWLVELPVLAASTDRLGKALLLRGRTLPGVACAQLNRIVMALLAREDGAIRPFLAGRGLAGFVSLLYAALDPRVDGVSADLTGFCEDDWPGIALIPGFGLEFDIESLVNLVAPRTVHLRFERAEGCEEAYRLDETYACQAHRLLDSAQAVFLQTDTIVSVQCKPGLPDVITALYDPSSSFAYVQEERTGSISQLRNRQDWRHWRDRFKSQLVAHLGGMPPRPPLDAHVNNLGTLDEVAVERVAFTSEEHVRHYGLLLRPLWRTGPLPVVLCLPGSSQRPEDLLKSWGRMVADAGYAAFIVDVKPARLRPNIQRETTEGRAMVWNMALDLMAAVDYLTGREDLDSQRLAVLGVSIGGTQAWMLAALDERIHVALPVVGVTSYTALFTCTRPGGRSYLDSHSWYYYYPILHLAEQYDLVGLIAPRPLLVLGMSEDNCFPLMGLRDVERRVKRLYKVLDVPDKFKVVVEAGPHGFPGALKQAALEWLDQWL